MTPRPWTWGAVPCRPQPVRAGSSAEFDLDAEQAAADREAAAADLAEHDEEAAPVTSKGRKPADEEEPEAAEEEDADAAPTRTAAAQKTAEEEDEEAPPKSKRRGADEDDEEKPAPKKPAKARSGCGCLLVGCLLGLLVGAAAPIGLALSGIVDPAKELGSLAGIKSAGDKTPPKVNPQGNGPKPPPAAADAGQLLQHGDFAKALEELKEVPADRTEALAQRGTARWLHYLQEQKAKNAPLKADDEAVKEARQDLEAAAQKDNPEALLALGNLQEYTAGPAEALKTYRKGLEDVPGETGLGQGVPGTDRSDRKPVGGTGRQARDGRRSAPARRGARHRGPCPGRAAHRLPATAAGAAADEGEAGFDFWAAVKAAQVGDYAAALTSLETARKEHDKLRFQRLRKAQNPLSDPTEEIFLRSVKEIAAYWQLEEYLGKHKLLAKGGDPKMAVDGLVKANVDLQTQT